MIQETALFTEADRHFLRRDQIDPVTQPDDTYDDETYEHYFAVYTGIARQFQPTRIFEIGVRYGCTAICMLLGLPQHATAIYRGIDDESQWYGSCARANANFERHVPWADALALKHNAFDGPPARISGMSFDLIHIDGLHAHNAVSNELRWCWPLLNSGGLIVCDDADTPGVRDAIAEFLGEKAGDDRVRVEHQFLPTLRNHHLIRRCSP